MNSVLTRAEVDFADLALANVGLFASKSVRTNGPLAADLVFQLVVGDQAGVDITVLASNTSTNSELADLAADFNVALDGKATASVMGGRLKITTPTPLRIHFGANSPMAESYGFVDGQTSTGAPLAAGTYCLRISSSDHAAGYQLLPSIGEGGTGVVDYSGPANGHVPLGGLPSGQAYLIKVSSPKLIPTIYDLAIQVDGGSFTVVSKATGADQVRRDVILGGAGNDSKAT